MKNPVKVMQNKPGFVSLKAAASEKISAAETVLGLKFTDEYRAYVEAFGAASFAAHELTGVCAVPRLNVVQVTLEERANLPDVPADWYVVEQANIDGIVIWQTASGEIYQTQPGAQPVKIADSLTEYIDQ